MKYRFLIFPGLLALAACNPSAEDIESALSARGFDNAQATCAARELNGRLGEREWNLIAEFAGDMMRSGEEWKDLTVREVTSKLVRLGDAQLIETLLRTGMGCALLGDKVPEPKS